MNSVQREVASGANGEKRIGFAAASPDTVAANQGHRHSGHGQRAQLLAGSLQQKLVNKVAPTAKEFSLAKEGDALGLRPTPSPFHPEKISQQVEAGESADCPNYFIYRIERFVWTLRDSD